LDFDVVAIDITSSMPSICIGNINKAGQIQSKAQVCVECSGIKKGVIEDLETVTVSLSQMIKAVKTQYGIDTRSAFINVPCYMCKISYHSVTEDIYNKEIDDEIVQKIKSKLLSAPRHEGYTVIDIALTKFMLDSNLETRDPLGKFANRLSASANIISIKTEYFEILKNLFEKLGMQMDGIVMNTLSGLSLLPFSDSERSNVVVLNISREITDITVCQFNAFFNNRPYNRIGNEILVVKLNSGHAQFFNATVDFVQRLLHVSGIDVSHTFNNLRIPFHGRRNHIILGSKHFRCGASPRNRPRNHQNIHICSLRRFHQKVALFFVQLSSVVVSYMFVPVNNLVAFK
jgi:hypothetical protein